MDERDVVVPPEGVLERPLFALAFLVVKAIHGQSGGGLLASFVGEPEVALERGEGVSGDGQEGEVELEGKGRAREDKKSLRSASRLQTRGEEEQNDATYRSHRIALDPLPHDSPGLLHPTLRVVNRSMPPRSRLQSVELVEGTSDGEVRDKVIRVLLLLVGVGKRRVGGEGIGASERVVNCAKLF